MTTYKNRKVAWVVLGVLLAGMLAVLPSSAPQLRNAYYMWRASKLPYWSPPPLRDGARSAMTRGYTAGKCFILMELFRHEWEAIRADLLDPSALDPQEERSAS